MTAKPGWLFVIRQLPTRLPSNAELLDQILMATAFDIPVSVLFIDAGVTMLLRSQAVDDAGLPPVALRFASLEYHDCSELVVETESLHALGCVAADLSLPVKLIPRSELIAWMRRHSLIIGAN